MVNEADIVVAYDVRDWGDAANLCKAQKKEIINYGTL